MMLLKCFRKFTETPKTCMENTANRYQYPKTLGKFISTYTNIKWNPTIPKFVGLQRLASAMASSSQCEGLTGSCRSHECSALQRSPGVWEQQLQN